MDETLGVRDMGSGIPCKDLRAGFNSRDLHSFLSGNTMDIIHITYDHRVRDLPESFGPGI